MQVRLRHHYAAECQRPLDAAVHGHIVELAAATALARLVAGHHRIGRASELEIVDGHDHGNAALLQQRQDRRRQMVIDIVDVSDLRLHHLQQLAHLLPRLHRVDDALRPQQFAAETVAGAELDLVREEIGPWRGQIERMLHGERNDLPADVFEQPVLLEKHDLGAAARIEIVVDCQQAVGLFQHHLLFLAID